MESWNENELIWNIVGNKSDSPIKYITYMFWLGVTVCASVLATVCATDLPIVCATSLATVCATDLATVCATDLATVCETDLATACATDLATTAARMVVEDDCSNNHNNAEDNHRPSYITQLKG